MPPSNQTSVKSESRLLILIIVGFCGANSLFTHGQESNPLSGSRLMLIDGSSLTAKLESFSGNGTLVVRSKQERVTFQPEQYLRYGEFTHPIRLDTLILNNGSKLACIVNSISNDRIGIRSRIFGESEIPTNEVRGIIFHQKSNRLEQQKVLDRILVGKRTQSTIVMRNDDIANGQLEPTNVKNSVVLSFQERSKSIAYSELAYLMLPVSKSYLVAEFAEKTRLGLTDGTRLVLDSLELVDDKVRCKLSETLTITAPNQIRQKSFTERISYFQPSNRKLRYLSASPPLKVVEKNGSVFLGTRFNRSAGGGPLISAKREFEWGIGTHADSQIIYPVRQSDAFFRVNVSLDDSGNPKGNALCRVLLLNQDNQWQSASSVVNVKHDNSLTAIEVDVNGAKAIALVTSSGLHGFTGDRVNWIDARMHQR